MIFVVIVVVLHQLYLDFNLIKNSGMGGLGEKTLTTYKILIPDNKEFKREKKTQLTDLIWSTTDKY